MVKKDWKIIAKKTWKFIWDDDSIWSWLLNVVLAFVLIKFIVYPGLGFLLSTSHPIVAVVSGSMVHEQDFEGWWQNNGLWYTKNNITRESFLEYPFANGFNRGDIMILKGKKPENIQIGDVIVFRSGMADPIIHRVVKKRVDDGVYYFQTKGDHNPDSLKDPNRVDETNIKQDRIIGNALVRIPFLGYIKIGFVEYIVMPYCRYIGIGPFCGG